jgi:hypothetical protein
VEIAPNESSEKPLEAKWQALDQVRPEHVASVRATFDGVSDAKRRLGILLMDAVGDILEVVFCLPREVKLSSLDAAKKPLGRRLGSVSLGIEGRLRRSCRVG